MKPKHWLYGYTFLLTGRLVHLQVGLRQSQPLLARRSVLLLHLGHNRHVKVANHFYLI